jgi:hypothetical protein
MVMQAAVNDPAVGISPLHEPSRRDLVGHGVRQQLTVRAAFANIISFSWVNARSMDSTGAGAGDFLVNIAEGNCEPWNSANNQSFTVLRQENTHIM